MASVIPGVAAGTVVVGLGTGTAAVVAFQAQLPTGQEVSMVGRTAVVALSFALIFLGVMVTQRAVHGPSGTVQPGDWLTPLGIVRVVSLGLGVVGLAAGMILFAETVIQESLVLGLAAGVVSIVAYLFGHLGLNGSII